MFNKQKLFGKVDPKGSERKSLVTEVLQAVANMGGVTVAVKLYCTFVYVKGTPSTLDQTTIISMRCSSL